MELSIDILKAVDKTIREDAREEAKLILSLTTPDERQEFLECFWADEGNVCCLVLDYAKKQLVKDRKLEQKDTDAFGKFLE
jgi:hypothetical protein